MNVTTNAVSYLNTLYQLIQSLQEGADLEITINNIVMTVMKITFEATLYKIKGLSIIDKRCVGYIKEMRNHIRPVSVEELENTSKNSSILLKVTMALDNIDKDLSEILLQALS